MSGKGSSFNSALVTAFACVAIVGLLALSPDRNFRSQTQSGAVGVGASVLPNPYNTLAIELKEWESDLSRKEAALDRRQQGFLVEKGVGGVQVYGGWLLALFLLMIFGVHLYVDKKRRTQV